MHCYYDNKRFNKIQSVEVFYVVSFICSNFPDRRLEKVDSARSNLLPQKSSGRYLTEYNLFYNWRIRNKVVWIDQRVMVAFRTPFQ
jgi:hypothetical protein